MSVLSSSVFMKSTSNCRLSQMQLYPSERNKSFTQNECQLPRKVELVSPRPRSKLLPREFSPKYFSISYPMTAAAYETLIRDETLSWYNPMEYQTSEFKELQWAGLPYYTNTYRNTQIPKSSTTFSSHLLIWELLHIGSPHYSTHAQAHKSLYMH